MQFSLIFFASGEETARRDKYRLVIESAKFADQNDFVAVWIPERHFTLDGCLYPNPAVIQAALARETKRIDLRAGSVVMPLHNPIRVAEEWSIVDNLSDGRVGISFASGWHPNDFVFFPDRYDDRNEEMYRGIEMLQCLWRGEKVVVPGGGGQPAEIRIYPTPIQRDLPIWITAAGNPATFARAGQVGAHVLTHLFNQSIEELAEKIRIYREALVQHGHSPEAGRVSLMLHSFVWQSADFIHNQIRPAFCSYLKSASYLLNAIAQSRGQKIDFQMMSPQDIDDYLSFVYERLLSMNRVLFGTPESCVDLMARLRAVGVDEVACQLDFGVATDLVLQSLPYLNQLREQCGTALFAERVAEWQQHYGAGVAAAPAALPVAPVRSTPALSTPQPAGQPHDRIEQIQARCQEEIAVPSFYQQLQARGVHMHSAFQGIRRLWRGDGEALGHVQLAEALEHGSAAYSIHPALLDACFQVLTAALPSSALADYALYLPVGLQSFRSFKQPGRWLWSHGRLRPITDRSTTMFEGDVSIRDEDGSLVAEISGLRFKRAETNHPLVRQDSLDQWFYELQWQPKPHQDLPSVAAAPGQASGTWMILSDTQGVGETFAQLLRAEGVEVVIVRAGDAYQQIAYNCFEVRPNQREDFAQVLDLAGPLAHESLAGVVHLWGLDTPVDGSPTVALLEQAQVLGCESVLALVQALAHKNWRMSPRLWLVTQGTQAVPEQTLPLAVAQSPLWGFGQTVAQEFPALWGGLIDLDPEMPVAQSAELLWAELLHWEREDRLAFRQGQRYVARLVRKPVVAPSVVFQLSPDSSYLITGGLGDLGLLVARWMADHGARWLILMGRNALPDRALWDQVEPNSRQAKQIAAIKDLERQGVQVYLAQVDVADQDQLTSFLTTFQAQGWPGLRGVVHAAGTAHFRALSECDPALLREVLRPKMLGGWLLHQLLAETKLDFFVLFSSWASFTGVLSQGLGSYGAANAFLDALAHYRRARYFPAISVNWGDWADVGMRARSLEAGHRLLPVNWTFTPLQGLQALERLLGQDSAQMSFLPVNWAEWQQLFPLASESPLFTYLVGADATDQARSQQMRATILAAAPAERQRLLAEYLQEKVGRVLGRSAAQLDPQQSLQNLGLDSLMAIELKNRIEVELGVSVPVAHFLQGPSVEQMTAHLYDLLAGNSAPLPTPLAPSTPLLPMGESIEDHTESLLAQMDQLSDEEVDALLSQMLK